MSYLGPDIINLKLFHFDPAAPRFALHKEARLRKRLGLRLTTHVRFYDRDGRVTQAALDLECAERYFEAFNESLGKSSRLKGNCARQYVQLRENLDAKKRLMRSCAEESLAHLPRKRGSVAIEQRKKDDSFRLLRRNEFCDLVSIAKRAHAIWVFVLPFNDLCTESFDARICVK